MLLTQQTHFCNHWSYKYTHTKCPFYGIPFCPGILEVQFACFTNFTLRFGYFAKFTLPVCQVQFAKLQSPYAQLSSPHSKACIPKLAPAHQQGQLPGPLHPVDCLNEVQPAHKFKKFWAVQCQNSSGLPKTQTAPHFFFFHRLPRLTPSHPSFPSLSPPFSLSPFLTGWLFQT